MAAAMHHLTTGRHGSIVPEKKKKPGLGKILGKANDTGKAARVVNAMKADLNPRDRGFTARFAPLQGPSIAPPSLERSITLQGAQTLESVTAAVSKLFGWADVDLLDPDKQLQLIDTEEEMQTTLTEWNQLEDVRKLDYLEALLESCRSQLSSSRADVQLRGCHTLWELACRPENHRHFGPTIQAGLVRAIGADDVGVCAMASAVVWLLAEVESTVESMPVPELVRVRWRGRSTRADNTFLPCALGHVWLTGAHSWRRCCLMLSRPSRISRRR
jgi:hypothetical protein